MPNQRDEMMAAVLNAMAYLSKELREDRAHVDHVGTWATGPLRDALEDLSGALQERGSKRHTDVPTLPKGERNRILYERDEAVRTASKYRKMLDAQPNTVPGDEAIYRAVYDAFPKPQQYSGDKGLGPAAELAAEIVARNPAFVDGDAAVSRAFELSLQFHRYLEHDASVRHCIRCGTWTDDPVAVTRHGSEPLCSSRCVEAVGGESAVRVRVEKEG